MSLKFRRGGDAIEASANSRPQSKSRNVWEPKVEWREDAEKKYVLILTPMDEVVTANIHEFVPVGRGQRSDGSSYTKYAQFLNRKDPAVGEDADLLEDAHGWESKERCIGVAVELEAVLETKNGRKRPVGFEVKTDTYTRRSDEGEIEVTQPVIGVIQQSSFLMWSPLKSLDDSQGPLYDVPLEIERNGTGNTTRYNFVPFLDMPVDLTPVFNYADGISFIRPKIEDVFNAIEAVEDDLGRAQAVADAVLMTYLEMLADTERYDELVKPIEVGTIKQKFSKKAQAAARNGGNAPRQARPSSRPASQRVEEEVAAPPVEEKQETKLDRFAELRAQAAAKAAQRS